MRRAVPLAIALVLVLGLLGLRAALHQEPWDHLTEQADGSFAGRIHLPRDGRYVFGCQCTATITVAGKTVRVADDPAGGGGKAIDLAAGVADLTVAAPRGARLLWHPPGRRGPLEYLPAAQLAPDPPGPVSLDGAIALAIVIVLAGGALWLAWPRLAAQVRIDRRLALGFAAVLVVALAVRL